MGTLHDTGASAPGLAALERLTKENAPAIDRGAQGEQGDCAEDHRKTLATMQARAALVGCTLHELADGGYLVCRWNLSAFAPCLRCVGDLLRRIGGAR